MKLNIITLNKNLILLLILGLSTLNITKSLAQPGRVMSSQEWKTLKGYFDSVWDVKFSPKGNFIAVSVGDGTIKVYDKHWKQIWVYQGICGNGVGNVDFSSDEKFLAFGRYKTIHDVAILRLSDNSVQALDGHSNYVYSVSFSPDKKYLVSVGWDNLVKIWKLDPASDTYKDFQTITLTAHVMAVAFSPDGQYMAAGGKDNKVTIFKLQASGKFSKLQELDGHKDYVHSLMFNSTGQFLASGSWDKNIMIWKFNNGEFTEYQVLEGHKDQIWSVCFNPNGDYIASGSQDKTIKLWEYKEGSFFESQTLTKHNDAVHSVFFSPDGFFLVSGSRDNTVKIWKWDGF